MLTLVTTLSRSRTTMSRTWPLLLLALSALPAGAAVPGVKAPEGFDVTLFAAPPDVSYPTCLAAAPDGTLFVGVDLNGSLGAKPGKGKIVRCIDTDGDGKADKFNTFAEIDSPRGLWWDSHKTLIVLHPPLIEALYDDDGDGKADRREVLVSGLGFDLKFRGADHTTNGKLLTGFIVRESGGEVEIRDGSGARFVVRKSNIDERVPNKLSVMPEKLVDRLTPQELASILAYLESLKGK